MNENRCMVVADLLPLYADKLVSPETAAYVEAHLESCSHCRTQLTHAAPLSLPEANPTSEEDQIANGLMERLNARLDSLEAQAFRGSLVRFAAAVGLFILYWRVLAWVYQAVMPSSSISDLIGLLLLLLLSFIASAISVRKASRLSNVQRRWGLTALSIVVMGLLLYPGPVLGPQYVPSLRDCPGGQPMRTAGLAQGWYRPPNSPIWKLTQAYRLEYTCSNPNAEQGYTRHLTWIGARTGLPLESGTLAEVDVTLEHQVPVRLTQSGESQQVGTVLATWQNPVSLGRNQPGETYYRIRLANGQEATLLFDGRGGDWFLCDCTRPSE